MSTSPCSKVEDAVVLALAQHRRPSTVRQTFSGIFSPVFCRLVCVLRWLNFSANGMCMAFQYSAFPLCGMNFSSIFFRVFVMSVMIVF
jgi:hypothetical protein